MDNENLFNEFQKILGIKIPWSTIDEVIVSNPNTLRPVKGAAFEILFDEIVEKYFKCHIKPGPGGDTDIDRVMTLNNGKNIEMQLKTCATSTVKDSIRFGVSLHKTHGEERRPRNLYPCEWPCPYCEHDGEPFPDFLIILHPMNGVLVVPKSEIPKNTVYKGHYADPAIFNWNSKWLNRWDLLGFPDFQGQSLERRSVPKQSKFPLTASKIHLTDEEIVKMLLMPENFRVLEMNLKGNLRQPALASWLKNAGIDSAEPTDIAYPKYDRITSNKTRIQIKGISKGLCNLGKNIIGVEVMGSHRQGAGRRYSDSDFDYLGLVIEPKYMPQNIPLDKSQYHFCLIPLKDLPLHYKNERWGTSDKIYEGCKFKIAYDESGCFLYPITNYRNKVIFRGSGPWHIDQIPDNI